VGDLLDWIAIIEKVRAIKFPNKKGDVGMWVGSHPMSYVIAVILLLLFY
jgi:hypothetical protein